MSTDNSDTSADEDYRSLPGETLAEQHALAELNIGFDGRQYRYRDYRYDRAADAAAYARLERSRGVVLPPSAIEWTARVGLTAFDRECMDRHQIAFNGHSFSYREYRYERLADALNAAARMP